MSMVTVTDQNTHQSVAVEKHDVAESIRPWYPQAYVEIDDAINRLEAALLRGRPTAEYEAFLALEVRPA